jgi:hypothetical protein
VHKESGPNPLVNLTELTSINATALILLRQGGCEKNEWLTGLLALSHRRWRRNGERSVEQRVVSFAVLVRPWMNRCQRAVLVERQCGKRKSHKAQPEKGPEYYLH